MLLPWYFFKNVLKYHTIFIVFRVIASYSKFKSYAALHKKMKFSIKDLFSKCDQIRMKLYFTVLVLRSKLLHSDNKDMLHFA